MGRRASVLLVLYGSCFGYVCAGGYYYDDQEKLASEIKNVLIANDLCANESDCTTKKMVFVGGQKARINVSLYGMDRKHQKALGDITNVCSKFFYKNGGQIEFRLVVTDLTKENSLNAWFWERKTVFEITYKGAE